MVTTQVGSQEGILDEARRRLEAVKGSMAPTRSEDGRLFQYGLNETVLDDLASRLIRPTGGPGYENYAFSSREWTSGGGPDALGEFLFGSGWMKYATLVEE